MPASSAPAAEAEKTLRPPKHGSSSVGDPDRDLGPRDETLVRSLAFASASWALTRLGLLLIGFYSFKLSGQPVPWTSMWIQWDANYYMSIATHGYQLPVVVTGQETGQSNINFFPVLPIAVGLVEKFGLPAKLSGVVAANLFLIVAGTLLHQLAARRFGRMAADWSVLSLLALPGSFFLSSPLSEPPFLAFSIASTLFFERRRPWLGSLSAALLSVTRLTGMTLAAGLALNWLIDIMKGRPRSIRDLLALACVPIPLLAFMAFMFRLTGDALAPLHSQQTFWDQHLDWPLQNFFAFVWAVQPRLQLGSLLSLIMASVLVARPRSISGGEWLFVILSVFSFSSSEPAGPSIIRYVIGLYPIHLAFGQLCARGRGGRSLLLALAFANGALMVGWSHGSDVTI